MATEPPPANTFDTILVRTFHSAFGNHSPKMCTNAGDLQLTLGASIFITFQNAFKVVDNLIADTLI